MPHPPERSRSAGHLGRSRGSATPVYQAATTPAGILKQHSLPVAVYFHASEAPSNIDVSRPLLLHAQYTSTKVRAVSLRLCKDGTVVPVGPAVVIPECYSGWFSIVDSDGKLAPHYSTVEEVVSAKLTFFLTRFDLPGYVRIPDKGDSDKVTYQKILIGSGSVLKLLGVYEDLNAKRDSFKRQSAECDMYAQCLNHNNQVVFLPLKATGKFYATAGKKTKNLDHVFLISQILRHFELPLNVRLVCGYMARVPENFTGLLHLMKLEKEEVILACTMTTEANATLIEMDLNSTFLLTAINDELLTRSPIYLKTLSYCQDEADKWRRQIKVAHQLTEDPETSSRSWKSSLSSNASSKSTGVVNGIKGRERNILKLSFGGETNNRERKKVAKPRCKSKEPTFRDKVREMKFKNVVRERKSVGLYDKQTRIAGEFVSIKVEGGKPVKGTSEWRQTAKQNTYILPHHQEKVEEFTKLSSIEDTSLVSVDNQEYSSVVDDISSMRLADECTYAEICDTKNSQKTTSTGTPYSVQSRCTSGKNRLDAIVYGSILGSSNSSRCSYEHRNDSTQTFEDMFKNKRTTKHTPVY